MNGIIVSICLIVSAIVAQAQQNGTNSNGQTSGMLEFGGYGGFSQYWGDVSNKSYFEKFSGETRPSFGFFGRFHFNNLHGLSVGFNRVAHYSFKDKYSNGSPSNLEFSGNSNAFFINSFLNMSNLFWGPLERKVSLFGTLGVGYTSWQSTLKNTQTNQVIVDYTNATSKNLRSESFYFPATVGLKFKITPSLSFFAEGTYVTLISDDLDYYRDGYQYDMLTQTHFGLSYTLPLTPTAPRTTNTRRQQTSTTQRRSGPVAPVYVIDYEKFPEMPGERIITHQLPILDTPKPPTSNEMPVPKTMSSDVEFRVQIYASRRKINNPQALFRNIQFEGPIIENVSNDGLYRYSTGSFRTYSEAEAYAKRLQNRGIHDAFVVAYRNNERISITPQMKNR